MHLEIEGARKTLTPDTLFISNNLHESVVNDLYWIWLIELHGRHEYLPTLRLVLPEGVRDIDERESFVLFEDVPCQCDVGRAAAHPYFVSFIWEWTLNVLEHLDYQGHV